MIELEEAREKILTQIAPLGSERVPLACAGDRYLSEPIVASLNVPGFDNSGMDGYAVRASELSGASASAPAILLRQGVIPAGSEAGEELQPGHCLRIFTGSPVPPGADAVVMQEETQASEEKPEVQFFTAPRPWENIRMRGEDIRHGQTVLAGGDRLTFARLGLLAALGVTDVPVFLRPKVAVLATGAELVEGGHPLKPGQIYESNRSALAHLLKRSGAEVQLHPLVPDDPAATVEAIGRACAWADAVITTGGASVGDLDFVKKALGTLGATMDLWRVAIKPGKPFIFARLGAIPIFGLPGNPVSALVTSLVLARPAILKLAGARELDLPKHSGYLMQTLVNRGERRHFLRVHVNREGEVRSAGAQASHLLTSMALANALVDLPPHSSLPAGDAVTVWRIDF